MDQPAVRPATSDDLEGLVASSAALFAEDAGIRDPLRNTNWPAEYGARWCSDLLADPQALVLVAGTQAEVVGHLFATFSEPSDMWTVSRAELVSLYVRPPLRGQGVGGRLVDTFTAWAGERGATRLHVSAYASNESALRLYQRHGFTPLSVNLANDL
jgi:GNAT superfamily N-acetyltransferase